MQKREFQASKKRCLSNLESPKILAQCATTVLVLDVPFVVGERSTPSDLIGSQFLMNQMTVSLEYK